MFKNLEKFYKKYIKWYDNTRYDGYFTDNLTIREIENIFWELYSEYRQEEIDLARLLLKKYHSKKEEEREKRKNKKQDMKVKDGVLIVEDLDE